MQNAMESSGLVSVSMNEKPVKNMHPRTNFEYDMHRVERERPQRFQMPAPPAPEVYQIFNSRPAPTRARGLSNFQCPPRPRPRAVPILMPSRPAGFAGYPRVKANYIKYPRIVPLQTETTILSYQFI
jgi:hypothetical protein